MAQAHKPHSLVLGRGISFHSGNVHGESCCPSSVTGEYSVLVVLRNQEDKSVLVGEYFVYGIMDREAMEVREYKDRTRVFCICNDELGCLNERRGLTKVFRPHNQPAWRQPNTLAVSAMHWGSAVHSAQTTDNALVHTSSRKAPSDPSFSNTLV